MNKEDKQFFEGLLVKANQSGKKETSGLVDDVKGFHQEIKTELQGVNKRLDTLNGSVAKQQDKLAQHDIINAQTTMSQVQIMKDLKEMKDTDLASLKKSDEENTKYINETRAVINTFKWLIGVNSLGVFALVAKYILNAL
jgi:Fic family protein